MYQVMHAKILPRELRVKTLPWHRCYIVCLVLNSRLIAGLWVVYFSDW